MEIKETVTKDVVGLRCGDCQILKEQFGKGWISGDNWQGKWTHRKNRFGDNEPEMTPPYAQRRVAYA